LTDDLPDLPSPGRWRLATSSSAQSSSPPRPRRDIETLTTVTTALKKAWRDRPPAQTLVPYQPGHYLRCAKNSRRRQYAPSPWPRGPAALAPWTSCRRPLPGAGSLSRPNTAQVVVTDRSQPPETPLLLGLPRPNLSGRPAEGAVYNTRAIRATCELTGQRASLVAALRANNRRTRSS
jgi:hypothetical protein